MQQKRLNAAHFPVAKEVADYDFSVVPRGSISKRDWSDSFDDFKAQDWEKHFQTAEYDTE